MTGPSKNIPNELIFEKWAESLDTTSKLAYALLTEIKESESDFATIKTELSTLRDNVKGLSSIIREGNGTTSIITQIALIDQKLEAIDKWIDAHINIHQESKEDIDKVRKDINNLSRRIKYLEESFEDLIDKEKEKAREQRVSVIREQDLEITKKKAEVNIKVERQKGIIKLLVGVIMALAAAVVTYIFR